jgi:hypothetical protein
MRHCRQCRADAVGLLGEDRSEEFTLDKIDQMEIVYELDKRRASQERVETERQAQHEAKLQALQAVAAWICAARAATSRTSMPSIVGAINVFVTTGRKGLTRPGGERQARHAGGHQQQVTPGLPGSVHRHRQRHGGAAGRVVGLKFGAHRSIRACRRRTISARPAS